jgi:hypothetical protein
LVAAKVTEALAVSRLLETASSEPREVDTDAEATYNEVLGGQDHVMIPPSSSDWGWRKRSVRRQQKYRYSAALLGSLGIEVRGMEEQITDNSTLQSTCKCYLE